MKKVLFFVAALLTLTFAACSKEDPNPHCWKLMMDGQSEDAYFWGTESEMKQYVETSKKALAEEFPDPNISFVKVEEAQSECKAHQHFDTYACHKITIEDTFSGKVYYEEYYWATDLDAADIYDQIREVKVPEIEEQGGQHLQTFDKIVEGSQSDCESHKSK